VGRRDFFNPRNYVYNFGSAYGPFDINIYMDHENFDSVVAGITSFSDTPQDIKDDAIKLINDVYREREQAFKNFKEEQEKKQKERLDAEKRNLKQLLEWQQQEKEEEEQEKNQEK
jgi:predicted ribosome quality control (RQC) complex YloA/Tae2 family protein